MGALQFAGAHGGMGQEEKEIPFGDTYSESTTFAAPADCTEVEPPIVIVDTPEEPQVTPTVVSAGVLPAAGEGARSGEGLALMGAGLALLLAAGGVARPRRVRR